MRTLLTSSNHSTLNSFTITILALLLVSLGSYAASGDVLFTQNFSGVTALPYRYTSGTVTETYSYSASGTTLSGLVGTGANLFTHFESSIKKGDIAINSSTGGNSVDATGFFQAYSCGDNAGYWSLTRTSDFATTAPTALKVSMDIWYKNAASGSENGVQFAIGDGFTGGLKSTSAEASSNVHSGFAILANNTPKLTGYNAKSTVLYATGITQSAWLSVTWVINNTGESLTYNNPTGSGTTTLANDKFDIWLKTQAGANNTYTKIVSAASATTASKALQEIYIGYNQSGKKHEFRLDNISVIDLTPSTCTGITPSLSYTPSTIIAGNTASPTVTGNPGSGAVSYAITSATPAGCATINATTGVVTGNAEGSVTVTATVAASGAYCSGSATANITISPAPTSKTIYLKPNSNWTQDGARFAVYYYNSMNSNDGWVDLDLCDQFYEAEIPADYDKCILCRMNGATTDNNWTNMWNQTANLNVPTSDAVCYTVPDGAWSDSDDSHWSAGPIGVCVEGTWLRFTGEPITLTAKAPGATNFQWYHNGTDEGHILTGETSATLTILNCTAADGGRYYCRAWQDAENKILSEAFEVKIPYLEIQTPGKDGSDRQQVGFTRASETDEFADCEIDLGVSWDYEFSISEYFSHHGNTGTMHSGNCTGWTMNTTNWCRIYTSKEGTYHFHITFTNSEWTPIVVSVTYPPMDQDPNIPIYIENTPDMNWDPNTIYYRIGQGKEEGSHSNNFTYAKQMTLVPGTARFFYTTTPTTSEFSHEFWAWHIGNNTGETGSYAIYNTQSGSAPITQSSNFSGNAIPAGGWTVYLNPPGGTGANDMNNNCTFYPYTHTPGMLTHTATVGATTNGSIRLNWTDVNSAAQTATSTTAGLAHTCNLQITAVPDDGYEIASLQVNGVDFTSGNVHILDANATIAATFTEDTYTITYHTNEGTINGSYPTTYTFHTGATLPTDVTKDDKEFAGWYDNESLAGTPITDISTTEFGNKEYWAKWVTEVPKVTYILGSCYVKNGVWTQGSDGNVKAWLFQKGATPAENNLKETTNISISSTSTGGVFFNTKDITLLDTESYWNTSSGTNRAIKAIKVGGGSTLTFNLSGMVANRITFYVFPNTKDPYSIDLKVNGTTTNHPIAANSQHKWHKYEYKGGSYSGEFTIKSNNKESRVVVIVEVPLVTITFDKNSTEATGTMAAVSIPRGSTTELEMNEFSRDDYRFLGWTEDAEGAGLLISDGADYTTEADVTLYAKWEQMIHTTITLDATGAYNAYTHTVEATYNYAMPEIATLPLRSGFVFDGYYDQPNGAGTKYYTGLGNSAKKWDKTTTTATLYAKWLVPCDLEPTLTKPTPVVTVWDQKKVDVGVVRLSCEFDTTGISYSLQSVSPADPINGCHFEYFDEQIHLMGTPNVGNTVTQDIPVTFTVANSCNPVSTYTITQTIRLYPANQKPKIAFIITGKEGKAFSAYSTADSIACDSLLTYLKGFYDITCVNGYATLDETEIANYYNDYDLLIVTDFLVTSKGYTNAIGTLIDKKPILSFEAYVANLSNWHIGSNPKDPKPKVQKMKVMCAGHAIFKNAKYKPGDAADTQVVNPTDTTVVVLDSLSSEKDAKGLQGFTINEAPDFVFLATVRDDNNNRDLVVCCERQVVFPARLLLYGINFYEMPNLSSAGKIIMRQMIDYLLMTDETQVADCSLVFDNNSGDHKWSNPLNWAPGYNIVPTPYHGTRIIAECWVDNDDAHAGSVKVNKGRDEHNQVVNGKLIIRPTGGLTIAGIVTKVNDTRYASPIVIKAEDLLIEANDKHNGALVYGNKESDVRATVQYYSRGSDALTDPVWQYMGTPFQAGQTALSMFRDAWMCRWSEGSTDGLGGLWQWVGNDDVLIPFEGYCITQAAIKTYTFKGKLNVPVTKTLVLDNVDTEGYAFAANSWTAPIKIQEMADEDFVNAERAIYIYHTGSYSTWETSGDPVSSKDGAIAQPGQYAVIPIHSSPYITGADSVIPAMQGFFVKTTPNTDARLKLVYNRVVYDSKYFKTSTQPMRAPSRHATANDKPEVMVLNVRGNNYGDRVHILSRSDFSDAYEDGWDGRKIDGDAAAPKLAVLKQAGEMAVAALPTAEERYLSFRAGADTAYTFHFDYDGDLIYLYDQVTRQATVIQTGNTYSFTATNQTPAQRFLITKNPPLAPTDLELVETENGLHIENYARQRVEVEFYDMQGRLVHGFHSTEAIVDIAPQLPIGVYMARIKAGDTVHVVKFIGKEGAL